MIIMPTIGAHSDLRICAIRSCTVNFLPSCWTVFCQYSRSGLRHVLSEIRVKVFSKEGSGWHALTSSWTRTPFQSHPSPCIFAWVRSGITDKGAADPHLSRLSGILELHRSSHWQPVCMHIITMQMGHSWSVSWLLCLSRQQCPWSWTIANIIDYHSTGYM